MPRRRSPYIQAIRRLEDLLIDCLSNPVQENWDKLQSLDCHIPQFAKLDIKTRVVREPAPPEQCCAVLVESFMDIRNALPEEVVVYVTPDVPEGDVGIRNLYLSRISDT